ncbi:hypothetical protein L249_2889 [Ophiocordyceps polyrhachis-furcata BCC 54312]|uniref:HTH APSES-type domain-containing protein n=1 Tax=Ophiocordyceps polyrhachis-furcata BCC 54312 TaxID=1330021 RepID=A0A367LPU6_9HYPO|nr:hypothetical protein L249_2889 [Ophiocordyceps polyrhachis-furcata BCC 54312]
MLPAKGRSLPSRINPLMLEPLPDYAELVARRRLNQTQLTHKIVGGNEADTGTLGALDYAHLRAPLPKGIISGVFKMNPSPSSYFLMRRSYDGFISATGMFKATFPYAETVEEEAERHYIKSLPQTDSEELAGSIWIPPEQALALAEEYNVGIWIKALLDPAKIVSSNPSKKIAAPPKFDPSKAEVPVVPLTPPSMPRTRGRSPVKGRKRAAAPPRKRGAKAKAEIVDDRTNEETMESEKDDAATLKISAFEPAVVLEPHLEFKVAADEAVNDIGTEQAISGLVEVLPTAGEPPSADEIAKMMQVAEDMVKQERDAALLDGNPGGNPDDDQAKPLVKKSKRKAADISVSDKDPEKEPVERDEQAPAKRARTEVEQQRSRVKRRALVGFSATVAVGALLPFLVNLL